MQIQNDTTYYYATIQQQDSNILVLIVKPEKDTAKFIFLPTEFNFSYTAGKMYIKENGNFIFFSGKSKRDVLFKDFISILEVDKIGKKIFEFTNTENSNSFLISDIEILNDSIILLDAPSSYYPYFFNSIYKYNFNQNKIIWKYLNDDRPTKLYAHGGELIKGHKVNEFLFCTTKEGLNTKPDSSFSVGNIVKLNADGKKIWSKEYFYYTLHNHFNDLISLIPTSDGNYLISGAATVSENYFPWLVKIDEDGNIVPIDTTNRVVTVPLPDISIYPNPASDYIIINQGEQSDMAYTLYDMQGRQVAHIDIKTSHTNVVWDLPVLQSGSYQMIVTQKGKKVMDKKIVVVR